MHWWIKMVVKQQDAGQVSSSSKSSKLSLNFSCWAPCWENVKLRSRSVSSHYSFFFIFFFFMVWFSQWYKLHSVYSYSHSLHLVLELEIKGLPFTTSPPTSKPCPIDVGIQDDIHELDHSPFHMSDKVSEKSIFFVDCWNSVLLEFLFPRMFGKQKTHLFDAVLLCVYLTILLRGSGK